MRVRCSGDECRQTAASSQLGTRDAASSGAPLRYSQKMHDKAPALRQSLVLFPSFTGKPYRHALLSTALGNVGLISFFS
jgi:hypothetical protein